MDKHANRKPLGIIRIFMLAVIFLLYYCHPLLATIYYVNPGESIQAAITAATFGDTVQVAPGTYYETITMESGVAVMGAGPTVCTINGDGNGPVVTASSVDSAAKLDGFRITRGSATQGGGMIVINCSPTISNCIFSNNEAENYGGGMYNYLASPNITNCIFSNNSARYGGAVYNEDSNSIVVDCNFISNSSINGDGGGICNFLSDSTVTGCSFIDNSADAHGGGISNYNSKPTVTNCTFSSNSAGGSGGGMSNGSLSEPLVTDCFFNDNSAEYDGGGIVNDLSYRPIVTNCIFTGNGSNQDGGGMSNYISSPIVTNCTFTNNHSSNGGGIENNTNCIPIVTNCTFTSNWAVINGGGINNYYYCSSEVNDCNFFNNEAGYDGGGLANDDNSSAILTNCSFIDNSAEYGAGISIEASSPEVRNCTLWDNTANGDGGGIWNISSATNITNCIFWTNTAGNYGGGIFNNEDSLTVTNCILWLNTAYWGDEFLNFESSPTVTYCNVKGGYAGTGNINSDPLFVDPGAGNFHLSKASPCIDAGDNSAITWPNPKDFEGDPRIIDCYNDGTLIVDMGADEAQHNGPSVVWVNDDWIGTSPGTDPDGAGPATIFGYDAFDMIQDAIDIVASAGTVNVIAGTYYENIVLKNGTEVRGSATHRCVIDGGGNGSVVTAINVDSTTKLNGFTITNGSGTIISTARCGGGIYMENSSLNISNCLFEGNSAYNGGGIYDRNYSSPTVNNCTFTSNSAENGGGLYNEDSVPTVIDCTFSGNSAENYGGGMYNNMSSPTVTECTFSDNNADYGGGLFNLQSAPQVIRCTFSHNITNFDSGGGMYNYASAPEVSDCNFVDNTAINQGGGMCNYLSDTTVTNCTFRTNLAESGGGIFNTDSSMTITQCTFSSNTADQGGGIYNYMNSLIVTVNHCTFLDNVSSFDGGGMMNYASDSNIAHCTFEGNSAGDHGGAMTNWNDSTSRVVNCVFADNQAGYGGGGVQNIESSPTIINCTFVNNEAAYKGGGIYNWNTSSPVIKNCTFFGNSTVSGSTIACDSQDQLYPSAVQVTNSILWDGSSEIWNNDGSVITVTYSDIFGGYPGTGNIQQNPNFVNSAGGDFHLRLGSPCIDAGDNSAITWPDPNDFEGDPRIIDCYNDGTLIVDMGVDEANYDAPSQVWIDDDWAETAFGDDPDGPGPATFFGYDAFDRIQDGIDIVSSPGIVHVNIGIYFENISMKSGVQVLGVSPELTIIDGNSIGSVVTALNIDSEAKLDGFGIINGSAPEGGGLYLSNSNPIISNCIIADNNAINTGGGIYNYVSSPTINYCTFTNNSTGSGGGMFNDYYSSPIIRGSIFWENTVADFGGGMYNRNDSSPTVIDCFFVSNNAGSGGGGILNENSPWPHLYNCTLVNNSANLGGGIYNYASGPEMVNCTFWANSADGGGAIFNDNSVLPKVINCTFSGNQAIAGTAIACTSYEQSFPSTVQVTNSILWDGGNEIWFDDGSTVTTTYSDIQGGYSGAGNINADPIFLHPDSGDFHLQPGSPCIDAGDNNSVPVGTTQDFEGDNRFVDDQSIPDTGNGTPPIVDMGIDEAEYSPPSVVWVDDDYSSGGFNDGHVWNHDAFDMIQDGIDQVVSPGTVYVSAGTYYEHITLKNSVEILGAGPGNDPSIHSIINGSNSGSVVIGDGVDSASKLDGFTITNGSATAGGGVYLINQSDPDISNCLIKDNFGGNNSGGGGMFIGSSSPTVTNCNFIGNSAHYNGGGIYINSASPTVSNCSFVSNTAYYGGGIYNSSSTPLVVNCLFAGNSASTAGGGIQNSYSSPTVINCTFSGNNETGIYNNNSSPTVTNSILWENGYWEIYNIAGSTPIVTYCNIQGGWPGTTNIDQDPNFVHSGFWDDGNWINGDYHLILDSPCIDVGDNNTPNLPATDLDGHPRILDGDCNNTDVVDMGVHEYNYTYLGDLDYNCKVDFFDFSIIGRAWMKIEGDFNWNWICDISEPSDDCIDWKDLAILCENWLAQIP